MPNSPPDAELSVRALLDPLVEALRAASAAVLVAPPGGGKTTLVPPALRAAAIGGGRRIVMLEPRRIAARAAARRIADTNGWQVGAEVGYQVRFERRASATTEILVVTEGILVQMLQADPFLDGVGVLIFDEFHERSLATDLSLAMARRVQSEVRPDLKLMAMSATLDPAPLAAFLGNCPVLTAAGAQHPVEIAYLDDPQGRSGLHGLARSFAAGAARGAAMRHGSPLAAGGAAETPLHALAANGVRWALAASAGDVLAFLPGVGEILRTAEALADQARRDDFLVLPLYGDLPPERQDAVLRPADRRKVVLATNVAESSITIDGVAAVVDTGLARRLRYDAAAGLDRLELARISRAAADQRTGRAGRQGPGVCLRLWPEREHSARPAFETPEITRLDLAGPALQLLAWGETDLDAFPWFEPPSYAAVATARDLLARLGALAEPAFVASGDTRGDLGLAAQASKRPGVTALGRRMARLPVHPRLARLLLAGAAAGYPREAALLAALLAERDPFVRPPRREPWAGGHPAAGPAADLLASRSDLLDRLDALLAWETTNSRRGRGIDDAGVERALNPGAARFVLSARDQLARLVASAADDAVAAPRSQAPRAPAASPATKPTAASPRPPAPSPARLLSSSRVALPETTSPLSLSGRDDALLRSLLAAYPDRLARRRAPNSPRAVMVGGRGVRLAAESAVLAAELFVGVEVAPAAPGGAGPRGEDVVRLASEVSAAWLPPERLRTVRETAFDAERQRVTAWQRISYDDLVIAESEVPSDSAEAAACLAAAAALDLDDALPLAEPEVASFLARARCLAEWMPDLALPPVDTAALVDLLPELSRGRRSFAELCRAPLLDALRGTFSWAQLAALDREAPERLEVPSGSQIRLLYEPGKPPVLAARIQELFGLAETPRVAGGRIAVLLHLLAPNQRPQQITDDLRSFWHTTYPQVRKELQGRYPRHAWPQDPWNARAERRPAPRRNPAGR